MDINQDHIWYRKLHWQVLGAMLLGAVTGLSFGQGAADTVGWVGDLFMRLLRMVIVPLVLASIVSGVAFDQRRAGHRTPGSARRSATAPSS